MGTVMGHEAHRNVSYVVKGKGVISDLKPGYPISVYCTPTPKHVVFICSLYQKGRALQILTWHTTHLLLVVHWVTEPLKG